MRFSRGFSIIEFQVVALVGGLLSAILVPAVSSARRSASMAAAMSNGRNIYAAAFTGCIDYPVGCIPEWTRWPAEGDFASSTDYFVYLVTNGVIDVSFDFFAAEGIPPARSSDPADFSAENNAWKLVLGLDGASEGTPFLFSRNYAIGTVPTLPGPIAPEELLDNGGKPFGTAGLVAVQKGGMAVKLTGRSLRRELFNPAGSPPDGHALSVLPP